MAARSVIYTQPDYSLYDLPQDYYDLSSLLSSMSISSGSSDECKTPSGGSSDESVTLSPVSSMGSLDESVGPPSRSSSPMSSLSGTPSASDEDGFRTPPQSPRKAQPKVTPEKMKQFCLKASPRPPQPALFAEEELAEESNPLVEHWATHAWIQAHQGGTKVAIEAVITTVRYISHRVFIDQLGQSISQANLHLAHLYGSTYTPGKNCIVLTEEGKSNLWVAELAKQHFGFNAERYMDLGSNGAEQFVSMLEGVSRDMDIVRSKFHDRTIVLFDDASYSGKQISTHLLQVRTAVHDYQLPIKEIVVIVPFATPYAQVQMTNASVARIGRVAPAYISLTEDLPMLSELSRANYDIIVRLWYKGVIADANKIGLAYFEHKVPNDQSFPVALAKGSVYHFGVGGKSQSQKGSFPLLETVIPDYKGTTAERFIKA